MTANLLGKALNRATQGNRNETGLWLACQLRDNGSTEAEAEVVMLDYASRVQGNGGALAAHNTIIYIQGFYT